MRKVYCGRRMEDAAGAAEVWRNGSPLDPARSQKLHLHSESFQWGYCGSGPAQLALALLLDALGQRQAALVWYQTFKQQVIAKLPRQWVLTQEDILAWYAAARPKPEEVPSYAAEE